MSSSDPPESSFNPVEQVTDFRRIYGTLGNALSSGIGGVISSFFLGLATIVGAAAFLIVGPLNAIAQGAAQFMDSLIGGAGDIVQQGAETAVTSIAPGATWAIGPVTYALSIAAIGGGLYTLAWVLGRAETSDSIPFTFVDLPLIGVNEAEEDDED